MYRTMKCTRKCNNEGEANGKEEEEKEEKETHRHRRLYLKY